MPTRCTTSWAGSTPATWVREMNQRRASRWKRGGFIDHAGEPPDRLRGVPAALRGTGRLSHCARDQWFPTRLRHNPSGEETGGWARRPP